MTKPRTILKFDTGADGFLMMIVILAGLAALILALGIFFIVTTF